MYTQLHEMAMSKDLDALEESWMQTIGGGELAPDAIEGLLSVADVLVDEGQHNHRVGGWVELLCACIADDTPAPVTLRLFWTLLRLFPENRDYYSIFCETFTQVHSVTSAERAFYDVSGIAASPDVGTALDRLDELMLYREGAFVHHESGWGTGRVTGVDPLLKQVKVDLEEKAGHAIAIDAVDSILEYLPPDGFRAMRFAGAEELRTLAAEKPVDLLGKVHDDFGDKLPVKEIKANLVPGVIPTKDWTKWWNKTKGLLRDTGYFRVGDRAPHTVERLEAAVDYGEELVKEFNYSKWLDARKCAKAIARKATGELAGAWEQVVPRLVEYTEGEDITLAIDAATILERGQTGEEENVLHRVIAGVDAEALPAALAKLPGPEAQKRAAAAAVAARPGDWIELAQKLVFADSDALREVALRALEADAPDAMKTAVDGLLDAPQTSPLGFFFFLNGHVSGVDRPAMTLVGTRSQQELLRMLLDLIHHLQHRSARVDRAEFKDHIDRVQKILVADGCSLFRSGIEGMAKKELRSLHERIVGQEEFTPEVKAEVLEIITEKVPDLKVEDVLLPWEEECLYTTSEGLERREDEFREIMDVKLPKNFEDIGRAAGFGDLSENAEYTAALETRDQLTRTATAMKDEIDRAKVITAEMVDANTVSLGTKMDVTNVDSGEKKTYSVLGPWDGNPEEGVLNYNSPLAMALFGKKAGETVQIELPAGTLNLTIDALASHFDSAAANEE